MFPQFAAWQSPFSICLRLNEAMARAGADVELWCPAGEGSLGSGVLRRSVPGWAWPVARRLLGDGARLTRFHEARFLRRVKAGAAAHCWPTFTAPTISPGCLASIRERGASVVLEYVNCHLPARQRHINEAALRFGFPPQSDPSGEDLAAADARLAQADYVFSPSPAVRESLLEAGVDAGRVLDTSYAWFPEHVDRHPATSARNDEPVFLFVGVIYFRKGIPLLLEAWRKAGVRGRLRLVGRVDGTFQEYWNQHADVPGVEHVPPTSDLVSVYQSADALVLPSFEEGSPLVIYEALANGLPILASPHGAGGAVRHGEDGFVVDPFDVDAWVDHFRLLAEDAALRERLGAAAWKNAERYSMDAVAGRRLAQLRAVV